MNDKIVITIFGIFCLTILELFALYQHIDGALFGLVVSVIAGAIGVKIGRSSKIRGRRWKR